MADGLNHPTTPRPAAGPRHRGPAAGLDGGLDLTRSELLEARRRGDVGLVHSWELVTAVDGPGTRMTIFLSGCPLRCRYCHNPDTMSLHQGTPQSVDEVMAYLRRRRPVFEASGGGLTLSGGEPLFQIEFTRAILRAAHAADIHTALDTSGFLGARLSDDDLDTIDLVLLDVKSGDAATYAEVTGGRALQPTLDFGTRLAARGHRMWIRFVLVPGLTDAPANIAAVADAVADWGVERVEVLPFHNMGADKWRALDLPYTLADTPPPTRAAVHAAVEVFRARGLATYAG